MRARSEKRAITVLLLLLLELIPVAAYAKKVSIKWKSIQGADKFELEVVNQSGAKIIRKLVKDTAWSGDVVTGSYRYRLRAIDRVNRPGQWSALSPLVVMPESVPQPVAPEEGAVISHYSPKGQTALKWSDLSGIQKYRIEVKKGVNVILNTLTDKSELGMKGLEPGVYTWSVRAVMGGHESEPSKPTQFKMEQTKLNAPVPIGPIGPQVVPAEERLSFRWNKVQGAKRYSVKLIPQDVAGRKPSSDKRTVRSFTTEENSIDVSVPTEGAYIWRIRALAQDNHTEAQPIIGPESTATFKLGRPISSEGAKGYIAVSTMLAPYFYDVYSPVSSDFTAHTSSEAVTGRLSGEYWLRPQIAVFGGVDNTFFSMNTKAFSRKTIEGGFKFNINITGNKFGWFFAPKVGFEGRDYYRLVLSDPNDNTTFQDTKIMTLGSTIGFDLRKQFSERWSLGLKFAYFLPIEIFGAEPGSRITAEASYRNLNLGVQGLYWAARNWGLGLGVFWDQRSISYHSFNTNHAASERVAMDAVYFFGSLIYSFGR